MYSITLKSFPWVAGIPGTENDQGTLSVFGSNEDRNLTGYLPVNTKFFLIGRNGGGESPDILRTITSVSFNSTTNENIFTFTPAPAVNWTTIADIVIQLNATAVPVYTKTFLVETATPDQSMFEQMLVNQPQQPQQEPGPQSTLPL